jgi:hypothetical protein
VELTVVGLLSIILTVSVVQAMANMPRWFLALEDRVAVKREAEVARAFLLGDLNDTLSVTCSGATFKIQRSASTIEYVLRDHENTLEPKWKDLYRLDGPSEMRVATFLSQLTSSENALFPGRYDFCLVFKKGQARRRTIVACRKIP